MAETFLNGRFIQKHDIEANWNKATNFVPKKGEIIVYDKEVLENGSSTELPSDRTIPYAYSRFKIGDGFTNVTQLEFADSEFTHRAIVPDTPTGTPRYIAIHLARSSTLGAPRSFELQVREYLEFGRWLINAESGHTSPYGVHTAVELSNTSSYFYLHPEVALSADYSSCIFYVYDQYGSSVDIGIKESELSADKITNFWVESVSELPSNANFLPLTIQKPVEVAQETGTSTTAVMSQKAVTDALQNINISGTITRADIPDFNYTHSVQVPEHPDGTEGWWKITITSEEDADNNNGYYKDLRFEMYAQGAYGLGHWTIVAPSWHMITSAEGEHTVIQHYVTDMTELYPKIKSFDDSSCTYYISNPYGLGGTVYIDDRTLNDKHRITGVTAEFVTELPDFTGVREFTKLTIVNAKEYEELKAKANAAAPQSTTYTKAEVDALIAKAVSEAILGGKW